MNACMLQCTRGVKYLLLRFGTAWTADEKGPLYSGDGGVVQCTDGVVGNHIVKISPLQGEIEGLRIEIRAWSPHLLERLKKSLGCAKAFQYPELDSNQHARRHSRLKTARLPISPPG